MANIQADPDLLEQVARELTKIAEDVDAQARSLASTGTQTAAAWRSANTNHYLENVNLLKQKISTSAGGIRTAANTLRQTATEVRRVEREINAINRGTTR